MPDRSTLVGAAVVGASLVLLACSPKPETEAPAAPEPSPAAPEPAAAEPAAPEATPTATTTAELGKPAPDFALEGVDGQRYKLGELKGKTVVLEWFNPDCPFVKFSHTKGPLSDLAKKTAGDQLVWLSINSGGEGKQGHGLDRNKEALATYAMQNPILLDPTGAVGRAYGAEKTPHLFIVDKQGVLVYRGGLDNAPMGAVDAERPRYEDSAEGALVNYITGALQDIERTQALRLSDTPAYGCSVKYNQS
jgi:peroxiredoxin